MRPTPDQIGRALPHVRYEIESLLLTPVYNQSDAALQESVYFRRMAHCRVLYAFFTKPASSRTRAGDDDVLCEDFGFPAQTLYGEDAGFLLARFNKDLFHLTYARLERTAATKPWPMGSLFPPVCKRSKMFIEHVLKSSSLKIPDAELKYWKDIINAATKRSPLQQNTSNVATHETALLVF